MPSETAHSAPIGSWGKATAIRPPEDIDLLFALPPWLYQHYERQGLNWTTEALQDVKRVLVPTYPRTDLRADRPVVQVLLDGIMIEVAPAFVCTDNVSIAIADPKQPGQYRMSTALAEAADLDASDARWRGNTRALVKMDKHWIRERNVPLKPFMIERLAIGFLDRWQFSHHDVWYYDWMFRDFLADLIARANTYLVMPGTGEYVWLGDSWLTRAETAYRNAFGACDNERDDQELAAGLSWQAIFGSEIPLFVS